METFECDVVVIGAGLSGLSAAYHLSKKDRSLRIAILEAKDRIGGRTLTRQLTSADGSRDFWDLGGEWVGRPQVHLQYLLRKFNINTFTPVSPQDGSHIIKVPPLSWITQLDLMVFSWKLKRLRSELIGIDVTKSKDALVWDNINFWDYREKYLWSQDAKEVVDCACRCMFGLAPEEMSLLYFLMYIKSAGGFQIFVQPSEFTGGESRVKGGVQQLCTHMINKVGKRFLYLNQAVKSIKQSTEGAHVTTVQHLEIMCQRVILAIPPHHAAAIKHSPPLSDVKLGLLNSVPLAYLLKFVITFEEAFWKKETDRSVQVFQGILEDDNLGPVGMVYDATSNRGNPALGGFISSAEGLDTDQNSRKMIILRLIEKLIGGQCHKSLEFTLMDWSREPYNGGCFLKAMLPGVTKYFNNELRKPHDRVHFAGTETATVWTGFMNGAVQSGFRAATEVLYHLRPLIIHNKEPIDIETPRYELFDLQKKKETSWFTSAALCVGVASVVYLLMRQDGSTGGETFVKNIRLVFEP